MKVLLVEFDLFSSIGGGQTFYKSLVTRHPEIEFYFFKTGQIQDANLPKNVTAIPYGSHCSRKYFGPSIETTIRSDIVERCLNIAGSCQGLQFDVVDYPDYQLFGVFLRQAFKHFRVKANAFALSMHGVISTTHELNWDGELFNSTVLRQTKILEKIQFETADIRYGISARYISEWAAISPLTCFEYDLTQFFSFPAIEPVAEISDPRLLFVGRTEKRKGPETAIDLVWAASPQLFKEKKLSIIGPSVWTETGKSSEGILKSYGDYRRVQLDFLVKNSFSEIARSINGPKIVLLPSKYDTFNLVSIESLFSGCPTFIGDGAGVCDYLDKKFPNIPYIKIKMRNPLASTEALVDHILNFKHFQFALIS